MQATANIVEKAPPGFSLTALRAGLFRSAFWSLASAVVARGANVVVLMICAHLLAQEKLGELAIVQSTVGLFGSLAGLGLGMTTTKFLAQYRSKDPAKAGRILALSLVAAAASGALMTACFVVAAPWLATHSLASPALAGILIGASGLLGLGVIESVQTGALTGFEAFARIASLSMWNGALSLPITILLAWTNGISGAIAGMTLSLALACVLNSIALKRECTRAGIAFQLRGCLAEWPILLGFSLPAYLSGVIVAPTSFVANALLVNQPGGYGEMALFAAADRFRYLLIFVPLAVCRIVVPALSRHRSDGDRDGYDKVLRLNVQLGLALTVIPALLCVAASPWLMSMFGESFRAGWPILVILALSAVTTVLNTQLGGVLLSADRAWTRMSVDVLLAVVSIAAAWVAVPRWGAPGLALAYASGYAAAALVLSECTRRLRRAV